MTRQEQYAATIALNDAIMRLHRKGYRVKIIAARLGVNTQRIWRVARAYAGVQAR